ncbi:MAG: cyanophycin synthetase, partial [Bacteroidia bacterium]|nr:cyanophycin synthetase [Bacteroidia bacterium]
DDYAHHPYELESFINAVRGIYPGRKVTGVFQPHLFSRTKDFASDFATSLALVDDLILLDIYPAREEPLDGISSEWLLEKVALNHKQLLSKIDTLNHIENTKPELLLIMGAGDIDRLVPKIKEIYEAKTA